MKVSTGPVQHGYAIQDINCASQKIVPSSQGIQPSFNNISHLANTSPSWKRPAFKGLQAPVTSEDSLVSHCIYVPVRALSMSTFWPVGCTRASKWSLAHAVVRGRPCSSHLLPWSGSQSQGWGLWTSTKSLLPQMLQSGQILCQFLWDGDRHEESDASLRV
ncbi:hypothetical protein DPEC_G00043630 [Dallia pectoralis]|uniref:Uncharacterized protein n=1 Tax=Dallia pectoralis TaxID=75939 RepID=A0ACC2H9S7_DALPE|nr:hypothetical protein DPEC_G00043630 [Dallia pectoralis]